MAIAAVAEFGENPVGDKSVNMSGTGTRLERLRNPDWKADHDSYTKGNRLPHEENE